ncbi:MAG: hypothetical protein ABR950_03200 [Candidatus Dormibacteria bacterium]
MPEESDPRQLAIARGLLRLEACLVPAGGGLLVGLALAGAGSSPVQDWTLSGGALLLWLLLVGAAVAVWVAVSIKLGQSAWAYWAAIALQVGVMLAAGALTYQAVWGSSGAAARGLPALVLPFLPLFLVPFAALVMLLHPASRASALPLGGQPAGYGR